MAVTKLEHTVDIARPVDAVFALVTDVTKATLWVKTMVEAEQTSPDPVGEGTTCRVVNKAMGRDIVQDFVVTEHEPNKVYATKSTSGPFPMETRYSLEDVDGGTRLRVESSADLAGVLSLGGPIINRMLKKQLETDHATLKRLLEEGA